MSTTQSLPPLSREAAAARAAGAPGTSAVLPAGRPGPQSLLRDWIRRFRREIAVVALFSFVTNLLMLAPTLYMLQVYDRVLVSRSTLTLLAVSLITLFLLAIVAFSEWSRSRVLVRLGVRLNELMAERVFRASFAAAQAGRTAGKPLYDLNELRQFLTGTGILAFFDTPWTPIYIGVLFLLHPALGCLAIFFAILQGCVAMYSHRKGVAPQQAVGQSQAAAMNFVAAKVRNAESITALGMVGNLGRRWMGYHQAAMQKAREAQNTQMRMTGFSKWLRYSQQSLGLGMGALLVIDGQLSAGAMIAANVLMSRSLAPIDQLSGSWRAYLSARGTYQRLTALLAEHDQAPDATGHTESPRGEIRMDDVQVAATPGGTTILHGVSMRLPAGKVTLLTGPSGSGKSTLARALLGVWPVAAGTVHWGDRLLTDWSAEGRGPCVGYLPQDVELFAGNIAENICRLTEVDSEKVVEAARTADLHEVVLRLPKGYDTPIGEAGALLSAGQRQRLGLARAVYGKPSLVVLDEPNANLDDAGEAALMRCILRLKNAGVAILVISHRSGVKAAADQIVTLVNGRIESIVQTPQASPAAQAAAALRPLAAAMPPGAPALGATGKPGPDAPGSSTPPGVRD
ncbi:MAG: type I secretion system permease/ATPase [Comamonadaceae bacterium]|nr:MAG: type I secretion system permease/ATPase [Comamonadaceae bacterium]